MTCLLEVCVDTAAGLRAAVGGGADRIELCAALDLGGLTPGAGLIELARGCPVPVRAMVRPRSGDFVFGHDERDTMTADIDAIRAAGLAGIVIGAMTHDGALDTDLLRLLVARGQGLAVTLHRCVDLLPDPVAAVGVAEMLGIDTILTSGGGATAAEGAATIARMRGAAQGRVTIMAGSGITADTVGALLAAGGIDAIHASCRAPSRAPDARLVALGFSPPSPRDTDASEVGRLKRALDQYARSSMPRAAGGR
jgi:copper homeostasis protein